VEFRTIIILSPLKPVKTVVSKPSNCSILGASRESTKYFGFTASTQIKSMAKNALKLIPRHKHNHQPQSYRNRNHQFKTRRTKHAAEKQPTRNRNATMWLQVPRQRLAANANRRMRTSQAKANNQEAVQTESRMRKTINPKPQPLILPKSLQCFPERSVT
jgi:hypothetical protein